MKFLSRLSLILAFLVLGLVLSSRVLGFTAHPILSGSMEPAIKTGSLALVKKVPTGEVTVGNVIAFRPDGHTVGIAHRVIEMSNEDGAYSFVTKGDNNRSKDANPFATKDPTIDRVFFSLPYMGYVASFLGTTAGFLFIGAFAALALCIVLLPSSSKKENGDIPNNHTTRQANQ